MTTTALHAHLAAHGAVHEDERGIALPRRFGADPAAEYADDVAVHEGRGEADGALVVAGEPVGQGGVLEAESQVEVSAGGTVGVAVDPAASTGDVEPLVEVVLARHRGDRHGRW